MVERGRWMNPKVVYEERKYSLCNNRDIEDEYHVSMICSFFKHVRTKYIKPYYYQRPSMQKFVELLNTTNTRERFRLMLFIKIMFKMYIDTIIEL